MKATLESLMAHGAFSAAGLVEEELTVEGPEGPATFTVYVRPLSYRSAHSEISARQANRDQLATRIAASICDEQGAPIFSVEDITGEADPDRGPLSSDMTIALLEVIARVNHLGKTQSR